MAAKQGLTAQLSQAGEDAKRAVLSRTGVTSSWFSNLNTVCTIKSAPPRSPEVLQMLALKSGWLYKRNEQHVWQSRWCCVVPHMFLYYFDANIGQAPVGSISNSIPPTISEHYEHDDPTQQVGGAPLKCQQNPTASQQEEWNRAVQLGYGNRKQHEKRSSLYLFNQGSSSATNTATTTPSASTNNPHGTGNGSSEHFYEQEGESGGAASGGGGAGGSGSTGGGAVSTAPDASKFTTLQPAGIIDLECYTSVHRSTENDLVLELAGDDQVNPDLRAFYFCAADQEDREDWTAALLNERHAALVDECEAYKQVCEGFAQQLQALHADLDQARMHWSEAQDELYRVRSQQEENRRVTWRLLEENIEKPCHHCPPALETKRNELRASLDTVRSQDLGIQAAVRMLLDYSSATEQISADLYQQKQRLEDDWKETGQSDQQRVEEMQKELDALRSKYDQEKKQWESQLEAATAKYDQSQKELQDVQKDLSSTRMEVTMYQSQQRTKMTELTQHKKILKKEVIGLRTKLENAEAELNLQRHKQENHQMHAEQERQKNSLLERYVEKIESQVKVQQNMMELMSASGSVMGGSHSVGQFGDIQYNSPRSRANVVYVRAPTPTNGGGGGGDGDEHDVVDNVVVGGLDDVVDDDDEDVAEPLRPVAAMEHGGANGSRSINHAAGAGTSRHSRRRHLLADDMDNKSHVSELTEDRTQRQYEVYHHHHHHQRDFSQYHDIVGGGGPSPRTKSSKLGGRSPRAGPPSYIIGPNNNSNNSSKSDINGPHDSKSPLATINSGRGSASATNSSSTVITGTPPIRRSEIPRGGRDNMSVSSESRKLSVAQRARLEADRQSTPVRVRVDADTAKAVTKAATSGSLPISPTRPQQPRNAASSSDSVGSQASSSMWRRMENFATSVGGVGRQSRTEDVFSSDGHDDDDDDSRSSDDDASTIQSTRATDYTDEDKKMSDSLSPSLSLAERQQLQRAKQLEFLQEQGLIKSKSDVVRSATNSTVDDGNASVASTNISFSKSAVSFPGSKASRS